MSRLQPNRLVLLLVVALLTGFSPLSATAQNDDSVSTIRPTSYDVPDTESAFEIETYISNLMRLRAANAKEYRSHSEQMPIALESAARKLLEIRGPDAIGQYDPVYLILTARVFRIANLTDEQLIELKDGILASVDAALVELTAESDIEVTSLETPSSQFDPSVGIRRNAGLATQFCIGLENAAKTELAAEASRELGEKLSGTGVDEVDLAGQRLLGTATRLTLVGQPFTIEGELLDKTPFDPATITGKTTLVYFWSSKSNRSILDLTPLQRITSQYPAETFAVVAVSLDEQRDAVDEVLQKAGIAWPCLFPPEPESPLRAVDGWTHPLALKYGVDQVPFLILVGQDGTVVAVGPSLKELPELLAQQLGN